MSIELQTSHQYHVLKVRQPQGFGHEMDAAPNKVSLYCEAYLEGFKELFCRWNSGCRLFGGLYCLAGLVEVISIASLCNSYCQDDKQGMKDAGVVSGIATAILFHGASSLACYVIPRYKAKVLIRDYNPSIVFKAPTSPLEAIQEGQEPSKTFGSTPKNSQLYP